MVEINHGNGYVTRYAHNKQNLVAPGDRIQPGQKIALMGATGRATGPNLHFEVWHAWSTGESRQVHTPDDLNPHNVMSSARLE